MCVCVCNVCTLAHVVGRWVGGWFGVVWFGVGRYTAVVTLMCQALQVRDAEQLVELVASLPEPVPSAADKNKGTVGGGGSAGACVSVRERA